MDNRSFLIVVADSFRARFFAYKKGEIQEFESEVNPKSKLANKELISDRGGLARDPSLGVAVYQPKVTAKEKEKESFAREVADHILEVANDYQGVLLIVEPRFGGYLTKFINNHIDIIGIIHKEITNSDAKVIKEVAKEQIIEAIRRQNISG